MSELSFRFISNPDPIWRKSFIVICCESMCNNFIDKIVNFEMRILHYEITYSFNCNWKYCNKLAKLEATLVWNFESQNPKWKGLGFHFGFWDSHFHVKLWSSQCESQNGIGNPKIQAGAVQSRFQVKPADNILYLTRAKSLTKRWSGRRVPSFYTLVRRA